MGLPQGCEFTFRKVYTLIERVAGFSDFLHLVFVKGYASCNFKLAGYSIGNFSFSINLLYLSLFRIWLKCCVAFPIGLRFSEHISHFLFCILRSSCSAYRFQLLCSLKSLLDWILDCYWKNILLRYLKDSISEAWSWA